jgi:Mn2+/Fe2+ NRAMP family transporter
VVFVAHVPAQAALRGIFIPSFAFNRDEAMALVAVMGTTISPYLFFWQAGQEVEEQHRLHHKPLYYSPRRAGPELKRIRADTLIGMGFSHMVALFAIGMIGTGFLAVPILAGSAAYAVSETFGWVEGLDRKWKEAKAFYGVILIATLGGAALNLLGVDPMKALYWTAVVNGLLAPPLMIVLMLMARNSRVMGRLTISTPLAIFGWISTVVMGGVALLFLAA